MMSSYSGNKKRTQLQAIPRESAVQGGKARRFQVDLKPKGVLEGEDLTEALAKYGFGGETARARMALIMLEGFIVEKLSEGYRIDTDLVSFTPRLSSALSKRDADPESDGVYVQGSVSARGKLRHALREKVEAVNPLARRFLRIFNVFDQEAGRFDEIEAGHTLSLVGHDIMIDQTSPDEGVWLEKRSGHWNRKPKFIQRAELLESTPTGCKVVFREPIPRGKYNIVVATRCGDGLDYQLRRIGHPVTAV